MAGHVVERDLQMTPSERAAALAKEAETGTKRPGPPTVDDEAALFANVPEVTVGDGDEPHMIIVGAGLVGSLLAIVLLNKGFKVSVYERYPDMRSIPSAGRSINLSVTSRGLRSVKALGGSIYDDILDKLATKIMGRIIHMPGEGGDVLFQRYGKDDTECNYSVSRIDLNKFLIDAAAKAGASFYFDHNLSETSDFASAGMVGSTLNFTKGPPNKPEQLERFRLKAMCPVIACDGAGSRVRYALRRAGLTTFTEDLLPRGYKEVLFPNPGENHFGATAKSGGEACHGAYGLHIWPRGDHMLMALANRDGSFTGTIYMDSLGEQDSFESMGDTPEGRERCKEFCDKYYKEAVPLVGGMDALVDQITKNPNGLLGTVRASRWAIKGNVLLIGDSCHAMVPFFGQGCNCGFEDTLWVSKLLDQYCCEDGKVVKAKCTAENFAAAFKAVETERQPSAEAICDMALENFVEMRDKTGDKKFQAMKKLENRMENAFPSKFRSRYAMVCYGGEGNVSYANAKELGIVQMSVLERLCAGMGDLSSEDKIAAEVEKVDLKEAERLIDAEVVPKQKELKMDLSTVKH